MEAESPELTFGSSIGELWVIARPHGRGPVGYRGTWLGMVPQEATIADLLMQFPSGHEDSWTSESDLAPAIAAARRQSVRDESRERDREQRERYGLDTTGSDDDWARQRDEDAPDLLDRAVLLLGTFAESRYIEQIRERSAEFDRQRAPELTEQLASLGFGGKPNFGDFVTSAGTLSCHDLGSELNHRLVWVLGSIDSARDSDGWNDDLSVMEVAQEHEGFAPLVRWRHHTRAASVERSKWIRIALPLLADWAPDEDWVKDLFAALKAIHSPDSAASLEFGLRPEVREAVLDTLVAIVAELDDGNNAGEEPDVQPLEPIFLPPVRLVKGADAAEDYAAEVLAALGFGGVQRTPKGTDGGIDVIGHGVVAQVKFEALPTGRPALQALYGIASLEGAVAVFFSLAGYTAQAVEWADRAGVACIEYEADGSIAARNRTAAVLVAEGAPFVG